MQIPRIHRRLLPHLIDVASRHPVVVLTGPRQSGKTTLMRMAFPDRPYVSLEAPDVRTYALEDPRGFLDRHRGGAIFDEIQRAPLLLSYLQGEVDERPEPGRFLLTGSQNFLLMEGITQSLAGRAALLKLLPFDQGELAATGPTDDPWITIWTGGYPAIHARRLPPDEWLQSYVATYVERDVRQVLGVRDLLSFQTFLGLLAGRTGQVLNLSGLGADAGVSHLTAKAWISVLETSYVATRLPVFHGNLNKRLIQAPKLHLFDSGLACALLGIRSPEQLRQHPLRGAIFETWVYTEILKSFLHRGKAAPLFYFRDRAGLEVDLIVDLGDQLLAVECKSGQTVADDFFRELDAFARAAERKGRKTRSIVVYGGPEAQRRTRGEVVPWSGVGSFDWGA